APDAVSLVERERRGEDALVAARQHAVGALALRQDDCNLADEAVRDLRIRWRRVGEQGDLEAGAILDGSDDDDRVTVVVAVTVHTDDGLDFHGAHATLPPALPTWRGAKSSLSDHAIRLVL